MCPNCLDPLPVSLHRAALVMLRAGEHSNQAKKMNQLQKTAALKIKKPARASVAKKNSRKEDGKKAAKTYTTILVIISV